MQILGTEYKVIYETPEENSELKDCDGYCDVSTKQLHVIKYVNPPEGCGDLKVWTKKIVRHEILHAFLYESGLWVDSLCLDKEPWSMNEEMVDWFAVQSPKIYKAFEEAGALW